MVTRKVKIEGPAARGAVVSAAVLRDLLAVLIEGSQRALRVRTEGRSTARGSVPGWIAAASEFSVTIVEGSTILEIEAPTLAEASPGQFRQRELFTEIDPDLPAIDYLAESLDAAFQGGERATLYDLGMLRSLEKLSGVFQHGVSKLTILPADTGRWTRSVEATPGGIGAFKALEAKIPRPQHVRIAGKLDAIRHSDCTFTLLVSSGEKIRGVAETSQLQCLQSLWGKDVVISGTVHFTADGAVQTIEAENLEAGSEREAHLWGTVPEPISHAEVLALRVPQGPRSGLNAIMGKWPGSESDDEIVSILDEIS